MGSIIKNLSLSEGIATPASAMSNVDASTFPSFASQALFETYLGRSMANGDCYYNTTLHYYAFMENSVVKYFDHNEKDIMDKLINSKDLLYFNNFDAAVIGDFTSGNNATFTNGGTLNGTLTVNTSSPITGTADLKYVNHTSGLNDWFAMPSVTTSDGTIYIITLWYSYDGATGDILIKAANATPTALDLFDYNKIEGTSGTAKKATFLFNVATGATTKFGFQTAVSNNGKIFKVDRIKIETYVYPKNVYAYYSSNAGQSIPNATSTIINYEDLGVDTHSAVTIGASWKFTAPFSGLYLINFLFRTTGGSWATSAHIRSALSMNGSLYNYTNIEAQQTTNTRYRSLLSSITLKLSKGDYISPAIDHNQGGSVTLETASTYNWITIQRIGDY